MTKIMEELQLSKLPETQEVLAVARRVTWYTDASDAIADISDFVAHLMTYGRPEDVAVIRKYLTVDDFRTALDHAPAGIMDARSWAYWNVVFGREPVPPMPKRALPDDPLLAKLVRSASNTK